MEKEIISQKIVKRKINTMNIAYLIYFLVVGVFCYSLKFLKDLKENAIFSVIRYNDFLVYSKLVLITVASLVLIISLCINTLKTHKIKGVKLNKNVFFEGCMHFSIISFIYIFFVSIFAFMQYDNFSLAPVIGLYYDEKYIFDIAYILFYFIIFPILEELIFRHLILRRLSLYSTISAIFISALLYGLAQNGRGAIIIGFISGIFLATLTIKTGHLINAIVVRLMQSLLFFIITILPKELYFIQIIILSIVYLVTFIYFFKRKAVLKGLRKNRHDKFISKLYFTRFTTILILLLAAVMLVIRTFNIDIYSLF